MPASVSTPSAAAASEHPGLRREQQAAPVEHVGERAGGKREQEEGQLAAVCMSATRIGDGASVVMSQAPAASCIHVPRFDTSAASQMRR